MEDSQGVVHRDQLPTTDLMSTRGACNIQIRSAIKSLLQLTGTLVEQPAAFTGQFILILILIITK